MVSQLTATLWALSVILSVIAGALLNQTLQKRHALFMLEQEHRRRLLEIEANAQAVTTANNMQIARSIADTGTRRRRRSSNKEPTLPLELPPDPDEETRVQ